MSFTIWLKAARLASSLLLTKYVKIAVLNSKTEITTIKLLQFQEIRFSLAKMNVIFRKGK